MGTNHVRFHLFGAFRAFRNGQEVTLPDRTAGTFLRLLLLSNEPFLDNVENRRRLGTYESIRTLVDKANKEPRFGQGGRYDFLRRTGLALRLREGCGICLEGEGWSCDVHDFEEIWRRRTTATEEELRRAFDLFEDGINLKSWPKDKVTKDSWLWVKERVAELDQHLADIEAELVSRPSQALVDPETVSEPSEPDEQECEDETEDRLETSGFDEPLISFNMGESSSTSLGDDLCHPLGEEEPWPMGTTEARTSVDGSDEASGPRGITDSDTGAVHVAAARQTNEPDQSNTDALEVEQRIIPITDDNPKAADVEATTATPPTGRLENQSNPLNQTGQRTITALGVVVVGGLILVFFSCGIVVAKLFGSNPPSNPGSALTVSPPTSSPPPPSQTRQDSSAVNREAAAQKTAVPDGDRPSRDAQDQTPEPIVRAPENPVGLHQVYEGSLNSRDPTATDRDVMIGRQLFTGYEFIDSRSGEESVAVYKLDRQFAKLICLVGVPDAYVSLFARKDEWITIEADGRLLKKIHISAGVVTRVKLSVKGVKALIITFYCPVVLVDPKLWR